MPIAKVLSVKNARAWDKNQNIKEKKILGETLRICLLNSTANPADFHQNWAGLAVLGGRS